MHERRKKSNVVTWDKVGAIALTLPGAKESTSYRMPAIKVRGKLFVRLREEGDVIVVRIEPNDRVMRMAADPGAFFVTEHYVRRQAPLASGGVL